MTLVIARADFHGVWIVSDEMVHCSIDVTVDKTNGLVVNLLEESRPRGWTSKVRPIPHLGAAVIGSGAVKLADELTAKAHKMRHGDVNDLVVAAPSVLRRAWAGLVDRFGEQTVATIFADDGDAPSHVMLAGTVLPDPDDPAPYTDYHLWRFDAPDFDAQDLYHGWYSMPLPAEWPKGEVVETFDTIDEMVALAVRMKTEPHGRSFGGALWATTITDGPRFTIERVHVFDEDRPAMLAAASD